ASSATFALNSAEYRFRFPVIGSVLPDGRTKLIQLSGERGPPHCQLARHRNILRSIPREIHISQ
ncbi:hypothetical protein, partial [Azospirillum argentinense]